MRVFSTRRFFQGDFHGVAEVAATVDLAPTGAWSSTALLAKHVAKNITERFGKSAISLTARTAHIRVYTGVAMLVVGSPLLRIRQHFVGFFGFFEFVFCHLAGVALVAVRVVFHRKLAIRLFNVFFRGVFGNTQDFVKVSFSSHGCQKMLVSESLLKFDAKRRADDSRRIGRARRAKSARLCVRFSLF